jgi:hypothetical protein
MIDMAEIVEKDGLKFERKILCKTCKLGRSKGKVKYVCPIHGQNAHPIYTSILTDFGSDLLEFLNERWDADLQEFILDKNRVTKRVTK